MADPLGKDPGQVSDADSSGLINGYTDIPDQSVEAIADRVQPRQIPTGVTRGIQQLGSDKVYSDGGNQQIIVEDSNEPRVLIGNQATFGEGFYVTKDGFNVKTNTNPANFIFNSNQNVFKIIKSGTVSIGAIGASAIGTGIYVHGLNYIPAVLAYQTDGTNYFTVPFTSFVIGGANDGKMSLNVYVIADANQITFYAVTSSFGSSTGLTFKYFLLQESAS